MSRALA